MVMRTMGIALSLAIAAAASHASAQDAALIAVGGSAEVAATEWDAAASAVRSELSRRGHAMDDAHVRAHGESPPDCLDDACFDAERTRLGVALLAVVSVFVGVDSADHAGSVVVSLADEHGTHVGSTEVGAGGLDMAARQATAQALELLARGGQPWLVVRGSPVGALVVVDGVERGPLPWEGALAEGEHALEVSLPGYAPFARTLHVAAGAPTPVEVALSPAGGGGDGVAWIAVGSILGAAGLGLGIATLVEATLPDSCSAGCASADPAMRRYDHPDVGALVAYGITGGVLLVGGIVMLAWGLANDSARTAPVSLRPDGLVLHF